MEKKGLDDATTVVADGSVSGSEYNYFITRMRCIYIVCTVYAGIHFSPAKYKVTRISIYVIFVLSILFVYYARGEEGRGKGVGNVCR